MKILVLSDLYPPNAIGGYEHRCKDTVEWLLREGYDVRVLTTIGAHDKDLPSCVYPVFRSKLASINARSWGLSQLIQIVSENVLLDKQIGQFKPDLIYTWNLEQFSNTLIFHLHQCAVPILRDVSSTWLMRYYERPGNWIRFWNQEPGSPIKSVAKSAFRTALPILSRGTISTRFPPIVSTRTYFTANWFREEHVRRGIETEMSDVIHSGIVLERFPFKERSLPAPDNGLQLLFLGRVAPDKNVETMLRGVALLPREIRFTLDIIGKPLSSAYLESIETLVRELDLDDRVALEPYVPREKVPSLLEHYHFLLFPSTREIFSRLLFEAMAVGLPIIAASTGGNLEVIQDGVTGIFFDPSSPEALALAIQRAVSRPELYRDIQEHARVLVSQRFAFAEFVQRIEAQIMSSVESKKSSSVH